MSSGTVARTCPEPYNDADLPTPPFPTTIVGESGKETRLDDFQHLDDYALLGVTPGATPDELKQAYRREITKYHPDRYRNADPHTQQYARERSQRITEAYAALTRNPRTRSRAQPRSSPPATATEQLAATYDRALRFLAAGEVGEAARLLRQIQKVDPFYRDVDEQLARADALAVARARRSRRSPLLWFGAGVFGALALLGGAYRFGMFGRGTPSVSSAPSPAAVVMAASPGMAVSEVAAGSAAATVAPTQPLIAEASVAGETSSAPEPSPITSPAQAVPPTAAAPVPTQAPPTEVVLPTDVPPTRVPSTAPPLPPTRAPVAVEAGQVLVADDFGDPSSGWASQQAAGYSLGYRGGSYAITSQPGTGAIFSYGAPLNQSNVVIAASVTPVRGVAGLIFGPDNSYRFVIAADGSYRVEQNGRVAVPASPSRAVRRGGTNRLAIAASERRASLYANGVLLANVDLSAPLQGTTYGFVVIAGPRGGEGVFDDLMVRTLPR